MTTIPVICPNHFSFGAFYKNFLLENRPCVLDASWTSNWRSTKEWVDGNEPNYERLCELFGDCSVPVVEQSSDQLEMYGAPSTSHNMKFSEFLACVKENQKGPGDGKLLYLKDWHFQKENADYMAYTVPSPLKSDWINNEEWTEQDDNPFGGDYRFVYFGDRNTWTPFHADVLNTFSWSANICGRKLWYFVPPRSETVFAADTMDNFIPDIRERKDKFPSAGVIELIQEAGQIMFVPSEWHHQVHNLVREPTISINHNWVNAANIDRMFEYVSDRLCTVRQEISHCHFDSAIEFENQCQLILNADVKITIPKLIEFLKMVIRNRTKALKLPDDSEHLAKELIADFDSSLCCCKNDRCDGELCETCAKSLTIIDYHAATKCLKRVTETFCSM